MEPEITNDAPQPQAPQAEAPAADAPPQQQQQPLERRTHVRPFVLVRQTPVGADILAEGCEFTDGNVVLRWRGMLSSTMLHDNLRSVELAHCVGSGIQVAFVN